MHEAFPFYEALSLHEALSFYEAPYVSSEKVQTNASKVGP